MDKKWIWSLVGVVVFGFIFNCNGAVASVLNYQPDNFNSEYNYSNDSSSDVYDTSDPGFALSPEARRYRQSKFFPLFTIVRFTSETCRTTSEENGICFNKHQCALNGGIAQGTCAQGLGVCCRFVTRCGGIVTQNGTAFQNPDYPSKYNPNEAAICQIRVRRQVNVCQLRLNFIAFEIDGPAGVPSTTAGGTGTTPNNDAGTCKTDSLAITSSGGNIPNICGNMNNQHIYVNYGSSDTVTLNLLLSGSVNRDRLWNIEILMIPCNSATRAPTGCLQYFTGISGRVESFNFQGGTHLANMDYSSCIRQEDGMRFIEWTPCSPGDVRIGTGVATTATAPALCTPTGAAATSIGDYLTIMGGISYPLVTTGATPTTAVSTTDRFCDATWPSQITSAYVRSSVRPFLLHFRTDSGEIFSAATVTPPTDSSTGFCLRWQQNPQ